LHGHNYRVEIVLDADELDERGFVTDYGDLSPIRKWIDDHLDHRHLNDVLGSPEATTAERLALGLFQRFDGMFPTLVEVRVSETPKTWASYRREAEA
jgi:6-pyruvoyltetrahydropterin/6-carboxytetrahydropterin synthase